MSPPEVRDLGTRKTNGTSSGGLATKPTLGGNQETAFDLV